MSLRSPLARVLGRGSAKSGMSHWWSQRLTAIALVPLTVWFVVQLAGLASVPAGLGLESVRAWVASGLTPVLLVLLIGALAWHSALGVQVVLEDYVHAKGLKLAALLASTLLHALLAVAGVYAVLRIAFTTGSF
jgi:succinate dehydrogenase / fumarate reductase, membrane anchor subunit